MKNQIIDLSPKDLIGYRRLLKFTEKIFNKGFTDLSNKSFNNLGFMIKQVPSLLKLKSYQSDLSDSFNYISNEKLRRAFSMHPLLVGGNPFTTTSIYLDTISRKKMGYSLCYGWNR